MSIVAYFKLPSRTLHFSHYMTEMRLVDDSSLNEVDAQQLIHSVSV